jgi:glycosyltransferase involved in cell wall biosynthesis
MRLLITTQAVDTSDPVLGFFHGWLIEFAKHFEEISVICLKEGVHDLPPNVHVYSLGKEGGESRCKYILRFFRYVWRLRQHHDAVFSHMNPHYIVLAGWFWRLGKKRVFLWRNHAQMNIKTWVAAQFSERVFYTSPFACTRRFAHAVQMPVGIDTVRFAPIPGVVREKGSVLFLGRLSPVKRPELFMRTAALLTGMPVHVYGDVPPESGIQLSDMRRLAGNAVLFHGAVRNTETPRIYSEHDMYINLTPEGSMDKTVLEAAACGTLVLATNRSFETYVPAVCMLRDVSPMGIAESIQRLHALPVGEKEAYRKELRDMVVRTHSLTRLAETLVTILNKTHD